MLTALRSWTRFADTFVILIPLDHQAGRITPCALTFTGSN
jgi:hypothetical protein